MWPINMLAYFHNAISQGRVDNKAVIFSHAKFIQKLFAVNGWFKKVIIVMRNSSYFNDRGINIMNLDCFFLDNFIVYHQQVGNYPKTPLSRKIIPGTNHSHYRNTPALSRQHDAAIYGTEYICRKNYRRLIPSKNFFEKCVWKQQGIQSWNIMPEYGRPKKNLLLKWPLQPPFPSRHNCERARSYRGQREILKKVGQARQGIFYSENFHSLSAILLLKKIFFLFRNNQDNLYTLIFRK